MRNDADQTDLQPSNTDTFSVQALNVLMGLDLIGPQDLEKLQGVREDLQQRFVVGQHFRSDWEARNSVLMDVKFTTPDAKYWQAVREQMTMYEQLVLMGFEYRKAQQRIRLHQATIGKFHQREKEATEDWERLEASAHLELAKISIEQVEFNQMTCRKVAKDRLREILMWQQIMEELKPHMKFGVDSYEGHQPQSYLGRFTKEVELLRGGQSASPSEMRNIVGHLDMAEKAFPRVKRLK